MLAVSRLDPHISSEQKYLRAAHIPGNRGGATSLRSTPMDLHPEPDGGATIRLSKVELVAYYNLLNGFLQQGETWVDGTPIPQEVLRPHRLQLHQLAVAIGRHDVPHPDA